MCVPRVQERRSGWQLGHVILLIRVETGKTNFKVLRNLTRSDNHPAHPFFHTVRTVGDLARPPEQPYKHKSDWVLGVSHEP
jgi:hypothetical protein